MPGQEDAAALQDVLGLGIEEPDGADVALEPVLAEFEHGLGGAGDGKKRRRRLVDAFIRGLGREYDGDQQLEGRAVAELGGRLWVGGPQPLEDGLALLASHSASASLGRPRAGETTIASGTSTSLFPGAQAGAAPAEPVAAWVACSVVLALACRARLSMMLRKAINIPRPKKAPGGSMAMSRP